MAQYKIVTASGTEHTFDSPAPDAASAFNKLAEVTSHNLPFYNVGGALVARGAVESVEAV